MVVSKTDAMILTWPILHIGRQTNEEVPLTHQPFFALSMSKKVSRHHAMIRYDASTVQWKIVCKSTCSFDAEMVLRPGSRIKIGFSVFYFLLPEYYPNS
jgi:hypothetical protein